jgi:tripartite-type tricarboxylate transporter receptor subunit TctC
MKWKGAPVVAFALALIALEAKAQKWPARPIDMIIPFPAGSGVDVIGRAVASALADQSGQQVVVNNRDGASGTIGFNTLAAATPDGSTIAFGPTTPIANAPYLVKGVRYRADSFDYLCQILENVFTIAVAPQSKFKSVQDLITAARENPGKLTYGHAGIGTIPHLAVETFAEALKLKFQPVPFRGDAPVLPTLLTGEIDFGAPAVSTIHGQNFRPLLVFWRARHPAYPDVPTAHDVGATSEVPPGHNGLYAPSGLPISTKSALERHCADAVKSDVVRQIITSTGQSIRYLSGADFQSQTMADYQFKGELIRQLGLAAQ